MRYHELLKQYINESGLSLAALSDQLVAQGLNIDKGYLSRLQNGKSAPASDEANRAIAKITGGDPLLLLTAALLEKAPVELQDSAKRLALLKHLTFERREATEGLEMATNADDRAEHELQNAEQELDAVLAEEDDILHMTVEDDSMVGSRIYSGDTLIVQKQDHVEDGELAVVEVEGGEPTLRRLKRLDGQVILTADNPKYGVTVLPVSEVLVIGKVLQVMFDPNIL